MVVNHDRMTYLSLFLSSGTLRFNWSVAFNVSKSRIMPFPLCQRIKVRNPGDVCRKLILWVLNMDISPPHEGLFKTGCVTSGSNSPILLKPAPLLHPFLHNIVNDYLRT